MPSTEGKESRGRPQKNIPPFKILTPPLSTGWFPNLISWAHTQYILRISVSQLQDKNEMKVKGEKVLDKNSKPMSGT